jgi:uncharacterized membrane protein
MVVLINDQTGIFNSFILWMVQGSFVRIILTFIIIIAILFFLQYQLHKVDPQNIVASNMIWLTLSSTATLAAWSMARVLLWQRWTLSS